MSNSAGSFDFASFDEKGANPIKKAFEKSGATVIEVVAPNRATRKAGYQVKTATFYMADGQQVMMLLKNDGEGNGDIYQVQLNKRVVPIKNVDNLDKAASEIAGMVKSGSPAFLKAQRRKQSRLKVDESDLDGGVKKKPAPATSKAKLEEATAEIKELDAQMESQLKEVSEKAATLNAKAEENNRIKAEIDALLEENEQLEGIA